MKFKFAFIVLALGIASRSYSFTDEQIISNYQNTLKKFRKQLCTRNDNKKFWSFTKSTNRGGFFVPLKKNEKIDDQTIQKLLPTVREKKQWIAENVKKIKSFEGIKGLRIELTNLTKNLNALLYLKKRFFEEKEEKRRLVISYQSQKQLASFHQNLRFFLERLFFLHTYRFPVDHKKMRGDFDAYKNRLDVSGQKRSNEIFFNRKLVEDGVRHPRWRGSDRSIRTLINTIYIRSSESEGAKFLSENMRYDLAWLLERISDYLKFDKSLITKRLERWERHTEKMYQFYVGLLGGAVEIDDQTFAVSEFIEGKGRSRKVLKDFVYKKQADVYLFWTRQSKINRVLFVMDTIILNEVGGTPDPGDLEKSEVLKVVINRSDLKYYSTLSGKDSIFKFLVEKNIKSSSYPWLNLMLKEGEFSFTYYFLTASHHVFCPDMSKRAREIRLKALRLGLKLLKSKDTGTEAVRYFSRASMLGRIDMTDLWSGFSPLSEKAGERVESPELTKKFRMGDYEFLYSFTSQNQKTYQVVKLNDKNYSVSKSGEIFTYRNPHNFRYFVEK